MPIISKTFENLLKMLLKLIDAQEIFEKENPTSQVAGSHKTKIAM